MAKRKSPEQTLLQEITRLYRTLNQVDLLWYLRSSLVGARWRNAGFVLPTTVFVLLILALLVGAILFRSFNRTEQVAKERSAKIIYNASTPAIDRARAKLDYMFSGKDSNLPSGPTPEPTMLNMLLNSPSTYTGGTITAKANNPYLLPGETVVPISPTVSAATDPDTKPIPAWSFDDPSSGTRTVYMIVLNKSRTSEGGTPRTFQMDNPSGANYLGTDQAKADRLLVRNGPLTAQSSLCAAANSSSGPAGWFTTGSSAVFRKSIQVYAVTFPLNQKNNTSISTLQYQQDREVQGGNVWGAWFRNDLEIFPGPPFNFNGAMHSEGNIIIGTNTGPFRSYLISNRNSCYYMPPSNSEISARGHVIAARISSNEWISNNNNTIDVHPGSQVNPTGSQLAVRLQNATTAPNHSDSVSRSGPTALGGSDAFRVAADPLQIVTQDLSVPRGVDDGNAATPRGFDDYIYMRNTNWPYSVGGVLSPATSTNANINQLINRVKILSATCAPYIDDTFRADNRYGPKPTYNEPDLTNDCATPPHGGLPGSQIGATQVVPGSASGVTTTESTDYLTRDRPLTGGASDDLGLDGYWERRARSEGLRVIVGQRLELGAPLAPYDLPTITRTNETRQRRVLRDNLAAVQAAAIYHYTSGSRYNATDPLNVIGDGYYPVACLSSTVHPGTKESMDNASTFGNATPTNINFLTGVGTNGWEFPVPFGAAADPEASFATDFNSATGVWRLALNNLANFAGDPDGAFPPKQEVPGTPTGTQIHPDPYMTSWGNFSELRRVIQLVTSGGKTYQIPGTAGYNAATDLSMADKTTLHTSACMLGMLAYNLRPGGGGGATPDADITTLRTTGTLTSGPPDRVYLPFYYLFPATDHGERRHLQANPTIGNAYVGTAAVNNATNLTLYKAVNPTSLALTPKPLTTWRLPNVVAAMGANACVATPAGKQTLDGKCNLIDVAGTKYRIPFKDTALMNGREMMNVRVMNFDLDLLRRSQVATGIADTWLPKSGLVYAFREDGMREDAIVRPRFKAWAGYETAWTAAFADPVSTLPADINRMIAYGSGSTPQDPPVCTLKLATSGQPAAPAPARYTCQDPDLTTTPPQRGVSAKSVDYYPDPERRPFGFRLRNGARLDRLQPAVSDSDNTRGITFVSDNPTYIQGDFNLHNDIGGTRQEEFTTQLPLTIYNTAQFYGRTGDNSAKFGTPYTSANTAGDLWRPSDILADAITLLSDRFCDGTVRDGIIQDGILNGSEDSFIRGGFDVVFPSPPAATTNRARVNYGCDPGTGSTSFLNQNLLRAPGNINNAGVFTVDTNLTWPTVTTTNDSTIALGPFPLLNNPLSFVREGGTTTGPIKISAQGNPVLDLRESLRSDPTPGQLWNSPTWFLDQKNGTLIGGVYPNRDVIPAANTDTTSVDGLPDCPDNTYALGVLRPNYNTGNYYPNISGTPNLVNSAIPYLPYRDKVTSPGNTAGSDNKVDDNPLVPFSEMFISPVPGGPAPPPPSAPYNAAHNDFRNGLCFKLNAANGSSIRYHTGITTTGNLAVETATNGLTGANLRTLVILDDATGRPIPVPNYANFSELGGNPLSNAQTTRINAIIVSGLVPSRQNQSYGGLHNFPRFLENWGGTPLYISGSLLQLNFSNYATGPFEVSNSPNSSWETANNGGGNIEYYTPPDRLWGYDVALQAVPASPTAKRFTQLSNTRYEFYRELPANDPYICRLRATAAVGSPCL